MKRKKVNNFVNQIRFKRIVKFIESSAILGLLVSLCLTVYERYESSQEADKQYKELEKIRTSISTRNIGIYPNYLSEINALLSDTAYSKPKSEIIIFQDILCYGIRSAPEDFQKTVSILLNIAKKSDITVVIYDINSRTYQKNMQDLLIGIQSGYRDKRNQIMSKLKKEENLQNDSVIRRIADFETCEFYFSNVFHKKNDAQRKWNKFMNTYALNDNSAADSLLLIIDSIKNTYLNIDIKSVTYKQLYDAYYYINKTIQETYKNNSIKIITTNEFHSMNCWRKDDMAILSFPSKYNSDEIGFYSQDPVFIQYIKSMLQGVENL
ncbi:MAG: hypothetical protein LBP85_00840 [Prevotellaceae bacterium]|jgi:hypothetical protein|nr:hypothetical protein [Prevotellaceae bacterium]